MGSGRNLKLAFKKYGIENFKREILYYFDNNRDLYLKEAEIVNKEFIKRKDTYNVKPGGRGGFYLSGEEIKQILIQKGTLDIWRGNISKTLIEGYASGRLKKSFLGRSHTKETKEKIALVTSNLTGDKNSQYGTQWIHDPVGRTERKIKIDASIPEGFAPGRLRILNPKPRKSYAKGTKRIVPWEQYDIVEMRKTMSLKMIGKIVGVSGVAVRQKLIKMSV